MIEKKLDQIIQHLNNLDRRLSKVESSLSSEKPNNLLVEAIPHKVREESFMEFLKKYSPEKETDKTLVIMYFLESKRNLLHITTKNISEGFKEVREKVPTNVADKIQMLHKKGLIMPGENVDKLKGWMITRSGLEYLEVLKNG